MFRAPCAHHQEVRIALHSLWYHHIETSEWSKITKIQFYKYEQIVAKFCVPRWLITEINMLRCTVSKTSYKKILTCLEDLYFGCYIVIHVRVITATKTEFPWMDK